MNKFVTMFLLLLLTGIKLQAIDREKNDLGSENETKEIEKKPVETSEQLFEYYGMKDGDASEKTYSTYFMVKGVRKLGATSEDTANIEMVQENKCIAERRVTKMGADPAAAMTTGFALCIENGKLMRMSRRNKEIELVVPAEHRKIELKVFGKSENEDTYFVTFEKLKNYKVNGTKYHQVIYREKKVFSDKQGKTLFAITKSYFVKDVGLVYEATYSSKSLETPSMEKVLNK